MNWLVIDETYLNYLRQKESKITNSNYGKDKYKPFFGILFETDKYYYVTQISHAQPRHQNMKNNKDFKKIYNPKDNRLLAVVNLNYMFPILKSQKEILKYKDIGMHRSFDSELEKSKYIDLLKTEISVLSSMNLEKAAKNVYENKYTKKDKDLAERSFDFKQLEQYADDYLLLQLKIQDNITNTQEQEN